MKIKFKFVPKMKAFIKDLDKKVIKVGIEGSTMVDAGGEITDMGKAMVHEFGSPSRRVPARPFLRPVMLSKTKIGEALENGLFYGDLGAVGESLAGEVRLYIDDMEAGDTWNGNTIKALKRPKVVGKKKKKDYTLLVDTGAMKQGIKSEVVNG